MPAPPPRSSSSKLTDKQDNSQDSVVENGVCKLGVSRSNSEPNSKHGRPKSTPPENGELLDARMILDGDNSNANLNSISNKLIMMDNLLSLMPSTSTNSLSSVGSQDSVVDGAAARKSRQQILEERHQDLLKKQKRLQDQFTKLQALSRIELPKNLLNELKKTGSESNLMLKKQGHLPNGLNLNCSANGYLPASDTHTRSTVTNPQLSAQLSTQLSTQLSSPKQANQSKSCGSKERKGDPAGNQPTSSTESQPKLFESSII